MKILLYIILAIGVIGVVISYILEKLKNQGDDDAGEGAIADLAFALKTEKARKAFAQKMSAKKSVERLSRSDDTVEPTVKRDIPPKKDDSFKQLETAVDLEVPIVVLNRVVAPVVVEQGVKNQAITFILQNVGNAPVQITGTKIQFQKDFEDKSTEYLVRAKVGNKNTIEAGATEEIRLSVDIAENATLGEITLIPIILAKIESGRSKQINTTSNRVYKWRVEPTNRCFKLKTEQKNKETAGVPFAIFLETYLDGQPDMSYQGAHRVHFTVENSPSEGGQIPSYIDLLFEDGRAQTDQEFCFYNTFESYVIIAKEKKPGGANGKTSRIEVLPAELGSLKIVINSPQKNNRAVVGPNTITALDLYNNIKVDYNEDTEIFCSEGKISGLAKQGHVVLGSSFSKGIADLAALGMKLHINNIKDDAKIVKLRAVAKEKTGYSDEITVLPAVPMPPSATQTLIKRLLKVRKKKILIANSTNEILNKMKTGFSKDYEVESITLEIEDLTELKADLPDVLFIDGVSKEGVDAYAILKAIRKMNNMECLPLFFIGSPTEKEEKISEVLQSGSIYISQPIAISAIRAMISDMLENITLGHGHLPKPGARLQGSEGLIYQIIAKIGEGGMGYIFKAKRLRDQESVIIKYLPPRDFSNIKSIVRFIQEAHTVKTFNHENLIMGYDLLMDRNRCFYVMEYIEGKTVEELINGKGKFKPSEALHIIIQVARALQSLEEDHNLVHRDIKPANIIVGINGNVKLVDFGIAKLSNHNLTTVGIILGTPYYLSPEQVLGKEIAIQSDIYSLGATFYHMVSGEVPFQGPNVYNIIQQRLSHQPRDPREYNPEIPRAVAEVIMKMMCKKVHKRHETTKELIHELEGLLQCIESGMIAMEAEEPLSFMG